MSRRVCASVQGTLCMVKMRMCMHMYMHMSVIMSAHKSGPKPLDPTPTWFKTNSTYIDPGLYTCLYTCPYTCPCTFPYTCLYVCLRTYV